MTFTRPRLLARLGLTGLLLALAGGCGALRQAMPTPPAFYLLDNPRSAATATGTTARAPGAAAPTLIVHPPHAASGFDSQRIIYVRRANRLEYFAHSEWADPPARMLAPLLVLALEDTGAFAAVVLTPSAAAGEFRIDTELLRLQHDFGPAPSQVRLTLRATITDNGNRRILAWREFDATVVAASEDPYGGVIAANQAVHSVLEQVAAFCAETVGLARPAATVSRPGT